MRLGEHDDYEKGVTGEIDLSRIMRVLSAKRWWVLGPTLAAFAAALVFVNVVKPRYSA
ncbi:MAG: Wzz/FepE/Etk N-terminal domain-containing protein, partial [Methylocystis sp.]